LLKYWTKKKADHSYKRGGILLLFFKSERNLTPLSRNKNLTPLDLGMFKFMNDKIVSCFTMSKAHFTHACGVILPKCGAKLGYQLVLGPLTLGMPPPWGFTL
jgi:hypothetical protein